MQSFWCAAQLLARREAYATEYLHRAGYTTYLPRLRETRSIRGRRVETRPPLFVGYCFVWIELQWHEARWCRGVLRLIMDGDHPAPVSKNIIDGIRGRERDGLVELPKPPSLQRGDQVRVTQGPFTNHLGLYQGQAPRQRVEILLVLLGGRQRVGLPASAITPVEVGR